MSSSFHPSTQAEFEPSLDRGDGGGSPGKRSMTQGLHPRSLVFRVESAEAARELGAAFGARDRNGVAEGAEAAVDHAAAGSGQPLRADLRERFEASVGADLSAVRVHTGDASAAAAAAVGARAYTVANDIHFGAGQYQPDDPFGMHLIAHEVAHTVQQAGGTPHRQHKLEVSAPADAAEVEADHAADAMVAGRPATIGGADGLSRKVLREATGLSPNFPGRFSLSDNHLPNKTQVISGSTEGLADAVMESGAFTDVPDGDPMFATIRQFCSSDVWDIPAQTKTQHVSTSRWGRNGSWNITIKPKLLGALHVGAGGNVTVKSGSSTSTSSSGGTSSEAGAEGGVEAGKGSATDGKSTGHGGGYSGGAAMESVAESQKFVAAIRFEVSITGGWEDGTVLSGIRVLGGLASFGLTEAARAGGEYAADKLGVGNPGPWSASRNATYIVEVPTAACGTVW